MVSRNIIQIRRLAIAVLVRTLVSLQKQVLISSPTAILPHVKLKLVYYIIVLYAHIASG